MNTRAIEGSVPVVTRPAMLASGDDIVASRKFLDDLDVGGEAGSGVVAPLSQGLPLPIFDGINTRLSVNFHRYGLNRGFKRWKPSQHFDVNQRSLADIEQPFAIGHRQVTANIVLEPYVFAMLGLDRKKIVARNLQCSS
jgi:hypothetical protein